MAKTIKVTQASAWRNLGILRAGLKPDLTGWFNDDPDRGKRFSVRTDHIWLDYSRQLILPKIQSELINLAIERDLKGSISRMFSGEKINTTENRAVLHTALRNLSGNPVYVDGKDVMPEVNAVLDKIKIFSREVNSGCRLGATERAFKNIVSIGIGGSYLGPEYLAVACMPFAIPGKNLRFISNVDPTDFIRKTEDLNPEETLVIVVSKTFTTEETIANAKAAKIWITSKLGDSPDVVRKHFIAVSTAVEKVKEFGIDKDNMFGFWDWVGGRYSAASAVGGVPLSLYLGFDNFMKIMAGAHWMDQHFYNEPFEHNIPVLAALIDIWNINFMGYDKKAILPYSQAYEKYPAHCQQTEMESNGKGVDLYGRSVDFSTGEIVFGEPGTNGQHSFYQLMHQGAVVPADFIAFLDAPRDIDTGDIVSHHERLFANALAQPNALAFGKNDVDPQKSFSGNRPSNVYLLGYQGLFEAGILLALLEHRAAVKGFIWGINSFDQFGVELGKKLGTDMRNRIANFKKNPNDPKVFQGLDSSSRELLRAFLTKTIK